MVLVPDTHSLATPDVLAIAFLFLADQARQNSDSAKTLFDDVEILEAVGFISNSDNAAAIRGSDFREVVDRSVANWISQNADSQIPNRMRLKLIYETGNAHLIDAMERKYDSLKLQGKLEFIDIVYRASIGKNGVEFKRCADWLQKPLKDETTAAKTRYQKRPAETLEVTVKSLAESAMAAVINKGNETEEPVELTQVFGIYPLSGREFSIVESEKNRDLLAERVRIRLQQPEQLR